MDLAHGFDEVRVDAAIRRGTNRLLALTTEGHWRGLPTLAGISDIWVTGFILAHLRGPAIRHRIIGQARSYLLATRHYTGGWSYNPQVPPDADSTAWCMIALGGVRKFSPRFYRGAETFLWSHYTGEGVATFRRDSGIQQYIEAGSGASLSGWMAAHSDVTVAAILATQPGGQDDVAEDALRRLIGKQSGAGFFDAYWWRGPHYTTTMVLRALTSRRLRLSEAQAHLLARAIKREQLSDGGFVLGAGEKLDPFTTALALESLCHLSHLGGERERRAAGSALLAAQGEDGGWTGDYVMRIPAPDVADPSHVARWSREGGGGNSYILDRDGLFATALACSSLEYWRRVELRGSEAQVRDWPVIEPERGSLANDIIEVGITSP